MTGTPKLYTAAQAREEATAAREHFLEDIAAAGGHMERIPDEEATARLLLMGRAVEVRCTVCDPAHSPRIAILGRGVDCCMPCRFRFADAKWRDDGRCDTCNAEAEELKGVKYRLLGGIVLPTGGVQPSVEINARVCAECLDLLEPAPAATGAADWN
jgi:hypothetical protein